MRSSRNAFGLSTLILGLSFFSWWTTRWILVHGVLPRFFEVLHLPILVFGMTAISWMLFRVFGLKSLFALMFAGGAGLIAVIPFPALVDESSHFAYIHYLVTHHAIPTVQEPTPDPVLALGEHVYPHPPRARPPAWKLSHYIYEAMHPPFYYVVASIGYLLGPANLIGKIYVLRCLGLLAFLGILFWILQNRSLLYHASNIQDDRTLFCVVAAFTLTPGILLRMCTISNFHLSLIFCVGFYILLYRAALEERLLSTGTVGALGLLTGAAIGTHFFNLTLAGVGTALLLVRARARMIPLYLALSGLFLAPWLAFNYHHYGQLTGWKFLYPMMQNIVNSNKIPYSFSVIVKTIPDRLVDFSWSPEENRRHWFATWAATWFLTSILCLTILTSLLQWRPWKKSTVTRMEWLSLTGFLLNLVLLVTLSIKSSGPTLLGRYFYNLLLPCISLV